MAPITNGVLCKIVWSSLGTPFAVNVIGATHPTPTSVNQAMANTVSAAIKSAFTSGTWAPFVASSFALETVSLRSVALDAQPEFIGTGAAAPGTAPGGVVLPPQVAICITLRTALAGQKFRGRVYLPATHVNNVTGQGAIAATCNTAAVGFVTAIQTALAGSGMTMAVLSRKLAAGNPVTLIQARNTIFDTQRRRAQPGI